ncbi:MAG: hypothetical protein ACK5YW_00025 [Betaproteobacteria bacterium]|nr:hypothetical protein [Rhodocyclaceae bacterium]MCA3134856.1 hypothetical protein [Rhodocyclaceae bacterium]MCA3142338.1 hypothetical protein [Rhodocyclaceae bacterium]MCA3146373.1 hypothetical protein [Rhodocyclaceae bacterium]MCE2898317.1 hypothetical protein [Betaproteobacteria bacterium]
MRPHTNEIQGAAALSRSGFSRGLPLMAGLLTACAAYAQEGGESVEKVAAQLANPLAPVTTLAAQVRAEFGNGPQDQTNYTVRLQPSFFKPLPGNSAFLLRTILPFRALDWPGRVDGVGDLTLVPYYVPDITRKVFVGYGASLGMPTASNDLLGSGKWTAGPAVIFAVTGQPLTWGALAQHAWSVAGPADRAGLSVTTVQPFATYLLGGGWSLNLTTETSYNWRAQAGGSWTVPVTTGASKVMKLGGRYVNFGAALVSYPKKPDFAPEWELRFVATYVVR